ncbi:MAG: hypothetical protein M1827_004291 [Pycnora praestabilis]|nr:MAG: hypothetical protein M1827_004291 [Pycnora praestabilis]
MVTATASSASSILPADEEEEDDYMSMAIAEPPKPKHEKETYTQRRIRKEREGERKGRTKSRAELEADATAARDAALSTSLDPSNKGFKMMARLGFKAGSALGKQENTEARTEPLSVVLKDDRGGIGLDSEKKRKFREEVEREGKRVKAEEGDYRERVRAEREEKRMEGMCMGAMKVAERLDTAEEGREEGEGDVFATPTSAEADNHEEKHHPTQVPLKKQSKSTAQINVLWRGLVRHREDKERERRMRYDLHQSLSRLPTYDDPDEDEDDKQAFGKEEEEVAEEDEELEEFNALEPAERLRRLVEYLRTRYKYCFWCKFQYPDDSMDGCPGFTEEDHD